MDRPGDAQKPSTQGRQAGKPAKSASHGSKSSYLIFYNFVSAALWSVVLGRVLQINATQGHQDAYAGAGEYTKWVQTLAGLEVVHAAIGLVRAPLMTTVMQVASRFLLVWGVVHVFPEATSTSPAYSSMLLAWSVTEVIRYSYFAINLSFGKVPGWMTWLRYNTFFVLYPLGISSECWLVWKATEPAESVSPLLKWAFVGILVIYIPGSYILFTHMMAQRKKVMKALRSK